MFVETETVVVESVASLALIALGTAVELLMLAAVLWAEKAWKRRK